MWVIIIASLQAGALFVLEPAYSTQEECFQVLPQVMRAAPDRKALGACINVEEIMEMKKKEEEDL